MGIKTVTVYNKGELKLKNVDRVCVDPPFVEWIDQNGDENITWI